MEKTDAGTAVGVDDPYAVVDRCDYLTSGGKCRYALELCSMSNRTLSDDGEGRSPSGSRAQPDDALEYGDHDRDFAADRRAEEFQCPVAGDPDEEGPTGPWEWADCPQFRCRLHDRECVRCGLTEERMAHDDQRPLLEEHHLSYAEGSRHGSGEASHEITVYLCRWCHAKVHNSWARIDDDVNPDPEAIAERETRRARQQAELGFESATDRYRGDE